MTRYEIIRGLRDKQAAKQLERFEEFCKHSEVLPIRRLAFIRTDLKDETGNERRARLQALGK